MQGKQPWIEQAVGVHASSQGEQTLPVLVRAALAHVQFGRSTRSSTATVAWAGC